MPLVTVGRIVTGVPQTPIVKVIVHPTKKGWSWTQVSRNGSAQAVAPKTYDSKSNAVRAGRRQMDILTGARDRMPVHAIREGFSTSKFSQDNPYAVVTVVDKDPNYV